MIQLRNLQRFFYKSCRQPIYAFGVAKRRLAAYAHYTFSNGYSANPEAITLFLTHRCNLRCKMCGQWGESGVTKEMKPNEVRGELKLDELKKIIDDVSRFRPNITLFGGEPLLYPGCVELVRHIKSKGMHCLMITNGSLLGRYAAELVEAGLDELNVSLDGGRDLHDGIRGMPGLFDKITGGLKEVYRLKKDAGQRKPLVNLQCTITKYNYDRLSQLLEVADTVKAESLTYHNLIFLSAELLKKQSEFDKVMNCSSHDWEGFVFDPEINPSALYKDMERIKGGRYTFGVDFYPNLSAKGLREYYENPSYLPSEYKARCLSPWIVAYVFPDGEVRPCLNFTYSYGNVKKAGFREIWNGEMARAYRVGLKRSRIFPVCVRCTELYRY